MALSAPMLHLRLLLRHFTPNLMRMAIWTLSAGVRNLRFSGYGFGWDIGAAYDLMVFHI